MQVRWLGLVAVVVIASCGVEDVELARDQAPIPVECMVCEAPDSCVPVENGTACSTGTCVDGVCVGIGCESGERFVEIAVGENHTCALGFTGTLYCWGKNDNGQLGLGDLLERLEPTPVGAELEWETVAAGWKHTCGQKRDNTSWCWGDNGEGELGAGDQVTPQSAPVAVAGGGDKWSLMDLGHGHSCSLDRTGSLWCWGRNNDGELGLGDADLRVAPTEVTDPAVLWRAATAGGHHTCAVDWDGGLFCWGDNAQGRLGLSDETDRSSPTRVAEEGSWVKAGAGGGHTCAVDSAGGLSCWGRNEDGEVGAGPDGPAVSLVPTAVMSSLRWEELSLGDRHSCAVAQEGTLWCWGRNDKGQLGLDDLAARDAPAQIGAANDWSLVSAGKRHTCGLRANGALFCWGLNDWGQLGLDDFVDRTVPTQVCPSGSIE